MKKKFKFSPSQLTVLVSLLVGLYGVFILATTLLDQFAARRLKFLNSFIIDIHLLFGLGFIYLCTLLLRRKRNAMYLTLGASLFLFGEGTAELLDRPLPHHLVAAILLRYIILPLFVISALVLTRREFKVRSDQSAFRSSIKLAVLVLIITLAYGVGGFLLMDNSDFHQEISFTSALHHTIDQFDLTTNAPLHPYTRRARIFMDSLSFVSTAAVVYVVVSLFQPVRALLVDQAESRDKMKELMDRYGAPSEDFFKLWPHDKHYFFSSSRDSGLAYLPRRGVALVLADPIGNKATFSSLYREFEEMCWANDWEIALIHIDGKYSDFYKDHGYQLQLIGQEAIVNIPAFIKETIRNKYFRNIKNRFTKENYSVEVLNPPHHKALVDRLEVISKDWLNKPGRVERGFVMGYYSEEYIQQCRVAVVRDAAQTIQAFMNLVPSLDFNKTEITYDMLRGVKEAPPNINDFLLLELMTQLESEGMIKINLGFSPLVGLEESSDKDSLIAKVLRFAYTNGDRIYSFSGLHRFKDKYDPSWEDRYLAYKGGVRGFTKMLNSLNLAMKVHRTNLNR